MSHDRTCYVRGSLSEVPVLATEWDCYVKSLYEIGITLNSNPDRIIWKANHQTGVVRAHLAYIVSLKILEEPKARGWHNALWHLKLAGKIKYFVWFAINSKILTWDALRHRGFIGPGICIF